MYKVTSPEGTTIAAPQPVATSGTATKALLAGGVVAGPLFIGIGLAQAFTRDGYDLSRHPLSLLSNGDLGWLQVTNFVVAGLLILACAAGIRRAVYSGRAGTWGPRLMAGYGVGLIAAGVFVADPADGFPPGTPPGMPEQFSWHSILHGVAAVVSFLSLIAACFVFARRFAARRQRGWVWYSVTTGVGALLLSSWFGEGASVTILLASALAFGWVAALAIRLRAELADA
jgi:hypothetical protein